MALVRWSRFTLRELLVVLLVTGLLGAIAIQVLAGRRWESRRTACASNLRALWQSHFNYAARYGNSEVMSSLTGGEFLLVLQRGPDPIVIRKEPFLCPLTNEAVGPGRTSYRGPAGDVNLILYGPEQPVAADKEGNHGPCNGGNVMTNLGDVLTVTETDALWIRARATTKE